MNPGFQHRAGFTLTEILMAVGILSVGLTMVATVFPVAIDQNRRSYELTQASLCARNAAAVMRLKRSDILSSTAPGLRPSATATSEISGTALVTATTLLPADLIAYNPRSFVYDDHVDGTGKHFDRSYSGIGAWNAGNFIPRIYMTRVDAPPPGTYTVPSWTARGPYRVTIVVFRARGTDPGCAINPAMTGGDYVVDRSCPPPSQTAWGGRGEAYLVDHYDSTNSPNKYILANGNRRPLDPPVTGPPAYFSPITTSTQNAPSGSGAPTPGTAYADGQPGAVIAFHTFFGD